MAVCNRDNCAGDEKAAAPVPKLPLTLAETICAGVQIFPEMAGLCEMIDVNMATHADPVAA